MVEIIEPGLSNVVAKYLKMLNVKITATTLKTALDQNPYYPSLYGLTKVLDKFNIPNQSFHLPAKELNQVETPFLAYIRSQTTSNHFVLVTSMDDDAVIYITEDNKRVKTIKEKFLAIYQQIIVVAEANEKSGEVEYESAYKKEKQTARRKSILALGIFSVAGLLLGILLYPLIQSGARLEIRSALIISAIKFIGISATILLLVFEVDTNNRFVKSICNAGGHTSCDSVLHSKGAKVLGTNWSELGFFYYASTLLFLFVPGVSFNTKIILFGNLAAISTPYILFSLYYQWRVVKQWCPLCIVVQVALTLEFLWSLFFFWNSQIHWSGLNLVPNSIILTICILIPLVLWRFLKPILLRAKASSIHLADHKRLDRKSTRLNSSHRV